MITPMKQASVVRVTVTLDPVDLDLLDRLARLEGVNRSQELRGVMLQLRPTLEATVEAFERAAAQRDQFDRVAAQAVADDLEGLLAEVEELGRRYVGAVSRLEGRQAVTEAQNPRASNTGVTPPPPPLPPDSGTAL